MRGRDDLDAVEPALLATASRVGKPLQGPLEVPVLHLLGVGTMGLFAGRRWRDQRQPVMAREVATPAKMGELAKYGGAVLMHASTKTLEIRDDPVAGDVDLGERQRRVDRHGGRAAEDRQPDATPRLLGVVELVAILRHAVFGESRGVARAGHTVAQRQVPNFQRL